METRRQLLHISVGLLALLLRGLTWPEAALLAAAAVGFNVLLLPRLIPQVLRDRDRDRAHRWTSGIALYPLSILGLVLLFPTRLDLVAVTWVILAVGDGMSTLVGTSVPIGALPWNQRKSVGGLGAFAVFGGAAAAATAWWMSGGQASGWLLSSAVIAAVGAGLAETVPIRLDDNVTVPVVAATLLWSLQDMHPGLVTQSLGGPDGATWTLLAVNAAVAAIGWAAGTVTGIGAAVGMGIGAVMILGAGPAGWSLLIATFVLASLATRLGLERKTAAGIAEERGGRRGPGNAIANTGVAAWAAFVAAGSVDPTLPQLALVAALVTAGSDTVASEVGKAAGRTTWLLPGFRRVPPGTTGAVSLEGSAAGVLASVGLSTLGAWLGLIPLAAIPVVVVAATVACLVEGVIGATLEARGMLTNDVVNFVNSALGAGLALAIWSAL